jgi:NAD-specific glutamate dehydrogenase
MDFRNQFHLLPYSSAPLFVPCGGRPEAVNSNNVHKLIGDDGKPRFQYIVEGANLFITQPARLFLEGKGAIVFKDASANKGGVTSSSLEVLAALSFADDEFKLNMQVRPSPPDMRLRASSRLASPPPGRRRQVSRFLPAVRAGGATHHRGQRAPGV